jgi:hypothetical protein
MAGVWTWRAPCAHARPREGTLAAYFLGREARIGKGVRIALVAALLHVLSGFTAFLVLPVSLSSRSAR